MNRFTFIGATALAFVLGLGSAEAFVAKPTLPEIGSAVTPAAMCGRTCRNGGRYIPGPPSVCEDEGLNYCGSSRGSGARIGVPGVGVELDVGGPRVRRGGDGCRTVTIERDDGSVRTVRRCD